MRSEPQTVPAQKAPRQGLSTATAIATAPATAGRLAAAGRLRDGLGDSGCFGWGLSPGFGPGFGVEQFVAE